MDKGTDNHNVFHLKLHTLINELTKETGMSREDVLKELQTRLQKYQEFSNGLSATQLELMQRYGMSRLEALKVVQERLHEDQVLKRNVSYTDRLED